MSSYKANRYSINYLVIAISIVAAMATYLIATPSWVGKVIESENKAINAVFGKNISDWVFDKSIEYSRSISRAISKRLTRKQYSEWAFNRGIVAKRLFALYTQRVLNMMLVGALFLPIILASMLDAKVKRDIAKANNHMIKQVRYDLGIYLLNTSILLPFVFLVTPLAIPPLILAAYWIIAAIALHISIRYYQYVL